MTRKSTLLLCVAVLAAMIINACGDIVHAETLTIAEDGKAAAKIVLSDSATQVEQTAAKELQSHLTQITGGNDWQVVTESEADKNAMLILVGNSKLARESFADVDFDNIPYDGIVLKTRGNKLLLAGHSQRGALYAVNTFLEDKLGCRWWSSTENTIPSMRDIVIEPLDVEYAPKLIYREAFYKDAFEPVFATRMKCNGAHERIPTEYGGHHTFTYFVHSFYPLIPPAKYFDDHPEWFSEIDGVRTHDHAQLCLTNDEMRAELTKNAIEALRKNPDSKFISISQNDWYKPCQCERCQAIAKAEESESGPLITFVNKVAEDIEKEFPDVWVETLAYQYTRKPPKTVKPRENVVVRLCTIECSFIQPLGRGEQNKSLRDDIEGWSKISHQLFIWDYVTNFTMYLIPHPNYAVLPENIRFFVDHGTIGLFEQGDAYTTIGDFVRPRNWVTSHLMWDPTCDEMQLLDEFLNGYYGEKSAPLLKEYMFLLVEAAQKSGIHLGCFRGNTTDWLDYDTLCRATELMNDAIKIAEQSRGVDSSEAWRLRREKMVIDYAWLQSYYSFKRYAAINELTFLGPQDPVEGAKTFLAMSDHFGNVAHREFVSKAQFDEFCENLLNRFGTPAPTPELCKDLPQAAWVDYQEYEFNVALNNNLANYVDDENASNGRAVRMSGDHFEWAVSQHLDSTVDRMVSASGKLHSIDEPAKFRVYAALRCEATAADGPAMTLGVYDSTERKGLGLNKTVNVNEIVGSEYKLIDLGRYPLNSHSYIWAAPPKRSGEVTAVYVDRFIIVKE